MTLRQTQSKPDKSYLPYFEITIKSEKEKVTKTAKYSVPQRSMIKSMQLCDTRIRFVICSCTLKKICYPLILNALSGYLRKERLNHGLSHISVASKLKICPDTVRKWEENRKNPRLRASKRIIDFLGYFPPIVTNCFSLRNRLYFVRIIRGETQWEAPKIMGVGASKFLKIELSNRRLLGEINEKIKSYVREAFSTLTNPSKVKL